MSDTPDIVLDEEAMLVRTVRLLGEVPVLAPPKEAELVAELVRLRDELRDAKEEDKPAMMQQYEHQIALLEQLRASAERSHVDPASPYFAHLRIDDEDGESRDLFLGKATRIDHGLRIVDWRNAPISRVFYSYQQGEDFEESFGGRPIIGTLVARRTVSIETGVLRRVDAPEGVFARTADGAWVVRQHERPRLAGGQGSSVVHANGAGSGRRLGQDASGRAVRGDKHLPDIAGLLDPEQFELITKPSSGFVVIRGTAGSGKTTVALHRIAWLAYDDPGIDSDRTLFLAFSRALRDYVERVLPALGVGRVHPITFPEWAADARRRHFPRLPKHLRDDTPEVVLRLKGHPATMVALERHIEETDRPATAEQVLDDWATVLSNADVIGPVLAELDPDAFQPDELTRALDWSRQRFAELLDWMDDDVAKEDKVDHVALDAEDDPLLLRAWQRRVGPLRDRGQRPLRYKHIAVDEVQDFSPIEVRVLLDCLDDKKSITLAGDTQQHVMASAGFTSWSTFFGWLGVAGVEVETLRIAYRSAEPIVTFANKLLGEVAEDDVPPMTVRSGPPVEVFRFTDEGAAVAFLADALQQLLRAEPLANVAVVAPNQAVAELYHEGLRRGEVPRLRLVVDEAFCFQPGVEVVDVRQVKGLEFDYVVIVDASARSYADTPASRRLLHVAATRAIHQLWVTTVGTPSAILRAVIPDEDWR